MTVREKGVRRTCNDYVYVRLSGSNRIIGEKKNSAHHFFPLFPPPLTNSSSLFYPLTFFCYFQSIKYARRLEILHIECKFHSHKKKQI